MSKVWRVWREQFYAYQLDNVAIYLLPVLIFKRNDSDVS